MTNGHPADGEETAPYLLYAEDNPTDIMFFRRALAYHNKALHLVHPGRRQSGVELPP